MLMPTSVRQATIEPVDAIISRVVHADDKRNEADADPLSSHSLFSTVGSLQPSLWRFPRGIKTYQKAGLLGTTGGVKRLIEPVLLVLPAVLQDNLGAPPCSPHANLMHA